MSIFALGDTHLSFSCNKPMDIFGGWQNYEERIEKNWKRVVDDKDTVIVAGDISWAMDIEDAREDFAFLESLPGEKLIMKGNHDYWWATKKKADDFFKSNGFKSLKILYNNAYRVGDVSICASRGWVVDASSQKDKKILLREAQRLEMSLKQGIQFGGEPIAFLHYPPITSMGKSEEIINVMKKYGVRSCYYAHLHSTACASAITGEVDGINFSLVSADYLNFCPKIVRK